MIDNAGLKGSAGKKMVTSAQRREAIAHLIAAHQMSERRACRVAGVERALVRYRSRAAGRCGAAHSLTSIGA